MQSFAIMYTHKKDLTIFDRAIQNSRLNQYGGYHPMSNTSRTDSSAHIMIGPKPNSAYARTILIVDSVNDWRPFYPSDQVMTFEDYLSREFEDEKGRMRIINLCANYSYLSNGYYCSLLAEARGHHVIPSIKVINDLERKTLYRLELEDLTPAKEQCRNLDIQNPNFKFLSFFGNAQQPEFQEFARQLFERLPCPILEVTGKRQPQWEITSIKAIPHKLLDDPSETAFAGALDNFSNKIWRKKSSRKNNRYDLAILVNDEEKLPPSNKAALKKFMKAGKDLEIEVELIKKQDYGRLSEFDALFIRETTAITHHTYRFAKKAESEGLVVIDDPSSILHCTNKVYLADLFRTNKIPSPGAWLLHKGNQGHLDQLENEAGFPLVLKIPDGSFSKGVFKILNRQDLLRKTTELFEKSSLLLAQEYVYTDYDWRIGVFNNKAIFACRYYMAKNHWQIYRHSKNNSDCGNFETMPTFEAPKSVLDAALNACQHIGDGLYGADVKELGGKPYVIEINDNPNIDHGVEDKYLGEDLYHLIMSEFLRRMENNSKGSSRL